MNAPIVSAQARLNRSRLKLSLALHQVHAAQGQAQPTRSAAPDWLNDLTSDPTLRVLLHTAAAWWEQHPLQDAAALANRVARQWLGPLAQRNPLRLVLGAAAVGGALVLLKPWRWISVPTLAAGLMPQLLARLVAQLRPVSWVEVLAGWLHAQDQAAPPT
jgi:hypothetical protein